MITTQRIGLVAVALLLVSAAASAAAQDHWVHVRVQEHDGDEEYVAVNAPLRLVGALLPTLESEEFRGGRLVIDDMDDIDLRAMLDALRDTPDGEFVTVRSKDENVRVAKERGQLLVLVEERDGDKARIRVPLRVLDAMLGSGGDEIDLVAALDALADAGEGDLISVESDDSSVRVWIDSNPTGD